MLIEPEITCLAFQPLHDIEGRRGAASQECLDGSGRERLQSATIEGIEERRRSKPGFQRWLGRRRYRRRKSKAQRCQKADGIGKADNRELVGAAGQQGRERQCLQFQFGGRIGIPRHRPKDIGNDPGIHSLVAQCSKEQGLALPLASTS